MAEARSSGGRGTTKAGEDDEPTGDNAVVRQFFAVQLQGSGMVMGLTAQKSSTRAYLADYLSLIFYIFSFSITNNIIYILVVSVVADYSKNRVEGGISLHLSKGCVFWRSPKKFRY